VSIALILSIGILALAPLLGPTFKRRPGAWQIMDGFVVTVVIGILTLNILPPVMESNLIYAPLLFIVGLALPTIAEQVTHSHKTHSFIISVPAIALIIHALGDGSLLRIVAEKPDSYGIVVGILLHRIGLATAIWWLVVTNHGNKSGALFMALMGLATLIGYNGADAILHMSGDINSPLIQAFAAGSLLHILLHPLDGDALVRGRGKGLHRIGTGIGLLMVGGILSLHFFGHPIFIDSAIGIHDHSQSDALDRFLHFGVGLSPLLIALAVAGLWASRLKFLIIGSILVWIVSFALLPYNSLPHTNIGILMLFGYAFVITLHFLMLGSRSVIAAFIPQTPHKH